jgi:formyltetrahydrofolate synthetase
MILASHPLMLLQHYGLPVIVALNRFGSDTEREIDKKLPGSSAPRSVKARFRVQQ